MSEHGTIGRRKHFETPLARKKKEERRARRNGGKKEKHRINFLYFYLQVTKEFKNIPELIYQGPVV